MRHQKLNIRLTYSGKKKKRKKRTNQRLEYRRYHNTWRDAYFFSFFAFRLKAQLNYHLKKKIDQLKCVIP